MSVRRWQLALPRLVLILAAALLAGIALGGLFVPHLVAGLYDLAVESANADNEIRAVYGGLVGGLAVFFFASSRSDALQEPGVWLVALVFGGMALGRLVSIAATGSPEPLLYGLQCIEALIALAAVGALRQLRGAA